MEGILKQENSAYESPKLDVVWLTTSDVIRTSEPTNGEAGGEHNPSWGI